MLETFITACNTFFLLYTNWLTVEYQIGIWNDKNKN